ncbi:ABC transporter permease [Sphaerobacter sp.]|uniref:ABC transporter permease n=1 Tax=Sphaerobacter sp. TaxID=2099654 RepID=UPI001E14EE29|nr:ABC transporter permease [Sphaerobacter sp.]MBX5444110.1 ABC transporter permease [Sphaerobacter sp.]
MAIYIARRLAAFIPTLLVVSLLIFFMIYLIPGDPVATMLGPEATAEATQKLREELNLDQPLLQRLVNWYSDALRGDLGQSYFLHQPVSKALRERLPVTLSLSAFALVVAATIGITAGVIASVRHGRFTDWGIMLLAILGISIPIFWLALNMIFFFSVKLGWFPTGGYAPLSEGPRAFLRHLALPGFALGLAYTALIARMTRSSMLDVLRQDYMRTAQAKGLRERVVILSHAFRNALVPIATILGLTAGELLSGSVITETVFNLPGVGRLVIDAVNRRDYPVVQGGILLVTMLYLFVNLVVDLLYGWIDPRIRYS